MMCGLMRRSIPLLLALLLLAGVRASADKTDELSEALLTDPGFKVRVQAALILGKLGNPRAVPSLIEALKDENDLVRGTAAASLGKLGDRRAVEALTRQRGDASSFVRAAVDKALETLTRDLAAADPSAGKPRFRLTVNIMGSATSAAARSFDNLLSMEVAHLPGVTLTSSATDKLAEWAVEGNITNLKVTEGRLDCDANVAIATKPGHSVKATASAGASVPGVQRANDPRAERDCLAGVAQQIAQEVGKFLSAQ